MIPPPPLPLPRLTPPHDTERHGDLLYRGWARPDLQSAAAGLNDVVLLWERDDEPMGPVRDEEDGAKRRAYRITRPNVASPGAPRACSLEHTSQCTGMPWLQRWAPSNPSRPAPAPTPWANLSTHWRAIARPQRRRVVSAEVSISRPIPSPTTSIDQTLNPHPLISVCIRFLPHDFPRELGPRRGLLAETLALTPILLGAWRSGDGGREDRPSPSAPGQRPRLSEPRASTGINSHLRRHGRLSGSRTHAQRPYRRHYRPRLHPPPRRCRRPTVVTPCWGP
jgi:hypothetical protein